MDDKPAVSLHPPTIFFANLLIGYVIRAFAGGWLPALAVLYRPPLTEEAVPLAVLSAPPLTDDWGPVAVLYRPPLMDEWIPLAVLSRPPETEAKAPARRARPAHRKTLVHQCDDRVCMLPVKCQQCSGLHSRQLLSFDGEKHDPLCYMAQLYLL